MNLPDENVTSSSQDVLMDEDFSNVLVCAINSGDTKALQRLLFTGIDVNVSVTKEGYTPCILAVLADCTPALQLICRAGANVQIKDNEGWTAFHHAAYRGRLESLELLNQSGGGCDEGNDVGDTPLLLAASKCYSEVVSYLLKEHFCDKNAVNHNRQTALHKAVMGCSLEVVKILLQHDATIDRRDESGGDTPLMYACSNGQDQIARTLLAAGADPLKVNKLGETGLYLAAKGGHANVVRVFLDREPDVTSQDEPGSPGQTTVFCAAASNGHANIVKLLINAGKAYEAKSAFQTAARLGHVDVIQVMISHMPKLIVQESHDLMILKDLFQQSLLLAVEGGPHLEVLETLLASEQCDINYPYSASGTVLHEAVRRGSIQTVELLLSNGADANIRDRSGITAFAVSVVLDLDDIVRYFLQVREFNVSPHGIDIDATDNYGNTPLHLATARGHGHILNILLNAGLQVDTRNEFGQASLHLAAYLGNIDIVTCLLDGNADINIRDRENNTALILTARRGHVQIAIFLLNRSCDYNLLASQDGDALQCAAKHQNITMCQILMNAGANPNNLRSIISQMKDMDETPVNKPKGSGQLVSTDIKQELIRMAFHPRSLQSWCRIAIRNCIPGEKVDNIEALPLPPRFSQNLLLRDYTYYH